jgi:hypothetical protein
MSHTLNAAIAVIGIDIGKNSFHIVGLDQRGAIVLRQKWWWKHGFPTCHPVWSAWKPASVRIISVANSRRSGMMPG